MDGLIMLALVLSPFAVVVALMYAGAWLLRKLESLPDSSSAVSGVALSCLFSVLWSIILLTKSSATPYIGPLLWLAFVILVGLMIETPKGATFGYLVLSAIPSAAVLFIATVVAFIIFDIFQTPSPFKALGMGLAMEKGVRLPPWPDENIKDYAPMAFILVLTSAFAVPGSVASMLARNQTLQYLTTDPSKMKRINKLLRSVSAFVGIVGSIVYAAAKSFHS